MRILILFCLAMLIISGCASHFTRVDFKYSSASHINYKDAMVKVSEPPNVLMYDLSEAFRRQGATVLSRKELNYHFAATDEAERCWEARTAIAKKEFKSYQANDFSMYEDIDRTKPYTQRGITSDCHIFKRVHDSTASWLLSVEFPPRSAKGTVYAPTVDNFFVFGSGHPIYGFTSGTVKKDVGIKIFTRLYIWAWRSGAKTTTVYLQARPVSGQIESAPGNSIGWLWWKLSDGYEEAKVVKAYVLLLQDYDREKSAHDTSSE